MAQQIISTPAENFHKSYLIPPLLVQTEQEENEGFSLMQGVGEVCKRVNKKLKI